MQKYIKYICFLLFIILVVSFSVYFINKNSSTKVLYTSEMLVVKDDIEYEIKINNLTKSTIYREGSVENIIYSYPREGKCRISLPDLNIVTGKNVLKDLKVVSDYTYSLLFSDSISFLKYLIDSGYSIKMLVSTSQYLEFFLEKDTVYKRLVIFENSLMVCDLLVGVELPHVYDYLKNYNYNNYISQRFDLK